MASVRAVSWAWVYFCVLLLGYAAVLFTTHFPPGLTDYPDWVYQGVLFQRVLSGHPVAGYALKSYPVPFSLNTLFLGVADLVMPWQAAAKLYLCVYFALAGAATWMLARALRVRSALLIVSVPSLLIVNLEFWWGRVAFEVGMCLAMMLIALALEEAGTWVQAALLVLTYFAHMEACACAMLFLGLRILYLRQWRRIWLFVPALALTAWYAAGRITAGNVDAAEVPAPDYAYGSRAYVLFKASTYFKILGFVNPCLDHYRSQAEAMVGRVGFLGLLVLCVGLTLVTLYAVGRGAWAWRQRQGYITVFVLMLIASSWFVPQIALGSTDPGSRLVLMGVAVGLFVVEWRGAAANAIAAIAVVFGLVNLYQFAQIDRHPMLTAHALDLPESVTAFAHVEPARVLFYYDSLEAGQMKMRIFETAMFRRTQEK